MHRIVGFDLGLANTAFAILEPVEGDTFLAKRVKSGCFTTSSGTLAERLQELAAEIGTAIWDPFGQRTEVAIEEQRIGPHTRGSSMAILGVVVGACVYADLEFALYSPRTWQAEIGVGPPPPILNASHRRKWIKDEIWLRVTASIKDSEELKGEHETDAAGIALCHIVKRAKENGTDNV